jgi:hypothetical protein
LPDDEDLPREAAAATYTINNQGKIQIEEKEQIKKRLGRSPDKWDAFVLTFALPERAAAGQGPEGSGGVQQVVSDVVDDTDPLTARPAGYSARGRGIGFGEDVDPFQERGGTLF